MNLYMYTHVVHPASIGPPEAASDFRAAASGVSTAGVSWVSGYDYNHTQTFVVSHDTGNRSVGMGSVISMCFLTCVFTFNV